MMRTAQDLDQMNGEELKKALRDAEGRLEDVIDEREFTLGQTGVHISARELATKTRAWERDEERLRARIVAIKAQLDALAGN